MSTHSFSPKRGTKSRSFCRDAAIRGDDGRGTGFGTAIRQGQARSLLLMDSGEFVGIGEVPRPTGAGFDPEEVIEGDDGHRQSLEVDGMRVLEDLVVADAREAGQDVDPVRFLTEVDGAALLLEKMFGDSGFAETERSQRRHDPIGVFGIRVDQQIEILRVSHISVEVDRVTSDEGVPDTVLPEENDQVPHVIGKEHVSVRPGHPFPAGAPNHRFLAPVSAPSPFLKNGELAKPLFRAHPGEASVLGGVFFFE